MTVYVQNADVIGVASVVSDTTAIDTLIVKQGVVLQATNDAFFFLGGQLTATIGGIANGRFRGLRAGSQIYGYADSGGSSDVDILAGASLTGGSYGIEMFGGSNTLTNAGNIHGTYFWGVGMTGLNNRLFNSGSIVSRGTGVLAFFDEGGTGLTVTNGGSIVGGSSGIYSAGVLDVVNSGTISATLASGATAIKTSTLTLNHSISNLSSGTISVAQGSTAISDGGGDMTIVNRGQIVGAISLAGGADSYDGTLGTVSGPITGGSGDDMIAGGVGRENINGGANNDDLSGGGGNDAFVAENNDGDDIYDGGDGIDRISFAGVTTGGVAVDIAGQSAGGISPGNIGNDTILNIEQIIGTGSVDSLFGDASANQFYGGGGGDTLAGLEGNDRLFGDAGADNIIGGTGRDYLTGGADGDTFRFQAVGDSVLTAGGTDLILDFVSDADVVINPVLVADTINLSAIDADGNAGNGNQAFAFIGYNNGAPPAFTGVAGQLRTYTNATNTTFVEADTNGDSVADFRIQIFGTHTMAASDFVL